MFDLAFYLVVSKILRWKELPPSGFLNDHENFLQMRRSGTASPLAAKCLEEEKMMSTELFLLITYVKNTYPVYFGITLRVCTKGGRELPSVFGLL